MRVLLTLSTATTRWNCMFTYSKGLTWNALKFSKIYLLIADHSFQIYCSVCIVFIVSICVSFLYICLTSETLHYPWIPSYTQYGNENGKVNTIISFIVHFPKQKLLKYAFLHNKLYFWFAKIRFSFWQNLILKFQVQESSLKGGDRRVRIFSAHNNWWATRKWVYRCHINAVLKYF